MLASEMVEDEPVLEDDTSLARRVAEGSAPEAEALLSQRFIPRIRAYGLRHLRSRDRAEDLVQEVLMTVLLALRRGRVEDLGRVDRFVLGTSRNVVHSWRRGERRRDALRDAVTQREATLSAVAEPHAVEAIQVVRCLHLLAPRAHAVLVLSFIEERTADEIAKLLDTSEGNVRVIRHRAVRALQECIDQAGGQS